jgi:hypothetical protein
MLRTKTERPSVPATEHAFTELPPSRLYIDTNICLDYLIASRPHHQQALRFFQHLTAHGLTTLYLSSLSWIEFTHVVTSQRFREGLSPQWQQQYRRRGVWVGRGRRGWAIVGGACG